MPQPQRRENVVAVDFANHRKHRRLRIMAGSYSTSKITTKNLIESFVATHGDKYDYSEVSYVKGSRNVTVICKDHGRFRPDIYSHRGGTGCPRCGQVRAGGAALNLIIYDGRKYQTLKSLAKEEGVSYAALVKRVSVQGMPIEDAVRAPKRGGPIYCGGVKYKSKIDYYKGEKIKIPYQSVIRLLNEGMSPEDVCEYIPSHGHDAGVLYVITNMENRKKYIGITTETIEKRFEAHVQAAEKAAARNSNSLGAAILEHGASKFKIEEIQKAPNIKELTRLEKEAISGMNTLSPNGYNISGGGCIGRPRGVKTTLMGEQFKTQKSAAMYLSKKKNITFDAALYRIAKGEINLESNVKLDLGKAREIRARHALTGESHRVIANDYGVCRESISQIIRNVTWKEKQAA